MNLKLFCINESSYLETSSVEAFSISFENGKSLYWVVDIAQPDAESLYLKNDFLKTIPQSTLLLSKVKGGH